MQEPNKFCSSCGQQNHISAQFCPKCGARYDGAPPLVEPPRSKQNSPLRFLAKFFAAVFAFIVLMQIVALMLPGKPHPQTTALMVSPDSRPTPTPSPTPVLSPAEHLAEAKKLLSQAEINRYHGGGNSIYDQAAYHLKAISLEAKEHKEAQRILGAATKRHERERAAAGKKREREAAVAESDARKLGADNVERGLLSKGYDATVTVSGSGNRTIKITYVFMNRPMVHQLVEAGLLNQLQTYGFRKVIFSDGYGNTWWYNL